MLTLLAALLLAPLATLSAAENDSATLRRVAEHVLQQSSRKLIDHSTRQMFEDSTGLAPKREISVESKFNAWFYQTRLLTDGMRRAKEKVVVQAIDFPRYRQALLDADQVLELNDPSEPVWNSREEWNKAKRGYEWAFDAIDEDKDDRISPAEYREFQAFKQKHADWQELLNARIGGK